MTGRGQQLFLTVHINGITLRAMVDSGATGNFMDHTTAIRHGFKLVRKERPYHLFALDGDAIGSKNGQVTIQTDKLDMKTLRGHTEDIKFDVTNLGTHKLVLGML